MILARRLARGSVVTLATFIFTTAQTAAIAAPRGGAAPVAKPPASEEPRSLSDILTGEAKTQYDVARILYRDGDYAGALGKFRRAYELSHEPGLLWNMAACEKNLRHYVRVLALVDQYVQDGHLGAEDLERARNFSTAVRAFVAEVTVRTTETGATLSIDDEVVGTTPVDKPVLVDMGKRKLRVVKQGFRLLERAVDVEGGSKQDLPVTLEPELGRVAVRARASDSIRVDDKVVGQGSWAGTLPVGPHVVLVSTPSGKSRRTDLVLADRETRELTIEIEGDDGGVPKWVWWVGGGVVVAGAAVGGYFLFRPSPAEAPGGTIGAYQVPK